MVFVGTKSLRVDQLWEGGKLPRREWVTETTVLAQDVHERSRVPVLPHTGPEDTYYRKETH